MYKSIWIQPRYLKAGIHCVEHSRVEYDPSLAAGYGCDYFEPSEKKSGLPALWK